jgi:hypothetical protein
MRGALVIALCATGCFSDRGVAIEVDVRDTGATSVELFIGKDACSPETAPDGVKCGGIQPPNASTLLPGDMWFRDAALEDSAPVKGRTVTFQLKSDSPVTLRRVIAVGFDQGMQPVATATLQELEIPTNNARVVTTALLKASPLSGTDDDRVKVWTKEGSPSTCLVVEHWHDLPVKRDFVVPASDPDCDGVISPKLECNANVYSSMYASGQGPTPDCFGAGPTGTCLLGSFACTDGSGITGSTCAPQIPQHDQKPVCVPSQFCPACTNLDQGCPQGLIDDGGSNSPVPRIECHVPTSSGGDLCQGDNTAPISLDSLYPLNQLCDQQPLLGGLQFDPLPTDSTHAFGGAVMGLDNLKARCSFRITWKSGQRMPPDASVDHGVVQLQTGDRITLLPIVFNFVPGCLTLEHFSCSPAGNPLDPLWTSCAYP